jgi:RNA polymerase sigma-70 factor (ECF subfamily)
MSDEASEAGEVFCQHLDFAYGVALLALRDPAEAEDAVQDAFLRFVRGWKSFDRSRPVRPYLARMVACAAANRARAERRRAARQQILAVEEKPMRSSETLTGEDRTALRAALAALEEPVRLAVAMRYMHGMSLEETAEVLAVPRSTASDLAGRGLESLRKALTAAGFAAAAPAALAGTLAALPQPAAPAALKAAIGKLVSGAALGQSTGAAAISAAAKGGLIVKIGLGVAVVGLAAGTTLWAIGGKSEEPAKPKAPSAVEGPASKFSTPATDPSAEWEDKGMWAGIGVTGYLDGPRHEAMSNTSPRPGVFTEDGGENIFRDYDPKTDRLMTAGGCGSAGELDGPLSRARFGGWGYAVYGTMAGNSKYFFMITRSKGASSLRRFDFKKRVVEPFAKDVTVDNATKICAFEDGIVLQTRDNLKKVSNDGKLLLDMKIGGPPGLAGVFYGESLGPYDPKNDRMYGSSREGQGGWVVWRWDLKDGGKFVGIVPAGNGPGNQPLRKKCATGPFKGSFFYCPGGLGFGPGDPDGRYPYMGGGDEANMYRLDLEKQEWIKLVPTADKKRLHFGEAPGLVQAWDAGGGIPWANDGTDNMYPGYRGWCKIYERVK